MGRTQSIKHDFDVLGQTQPAHSTANGSPAFSGGVLHSWKDISKYTGRGVRTVQRYEAQLGLPVHRVAGKKRTAVMAFTDEIDHWLRTRPQSIASDEAAAENHSAEMTVEQARQAAQKAYEAFQIALRRYVQVETSSDELGTGTNPWGGGMNPYWREGVEFLRSELQLGITLAEIGLSATYPDKIVRNMARARQAYNAACKYRGRLLLDVERSNALDDLLSTLHAHLLRLQERMNVRQVPGAVVFPAVVPASKNGTDGL